MSFKLPIIAASFVVLASATMTPPVAAQGQKPAVKPASTTPASVSTSTAGSVVPPHAPGAPPVAAGFWQVPDENGNVNGWFLFVEKNGVYEGRLVKSFPKPGEPVVQNCTRCTDDRKNAPMLGLSIVRGMQRNGLDYTSGTILDPRDGSVYKAQMSLTPDGQTLNVRGYIGIPMLGKTISWTRLPDTSMSAADLPKDALASAAPKH